MHIRRLKRAESADDLDERTVEWISDGFCHGSGHIRKVVRGEHRDSRWSKQQLHQACLRIIALYNQVAIRERTADQLSREAREDLLKREFSAMSEISTSLHIIRLGEAGAERYRSKVVNDEARDDFERSSGNARSYRHFAKELELTQQPRPRSQTQSRRPRSSSGRSARTTRSVSRRRKPYGRSRSGFRRAAGRYRQRPFGASGPRRGNPHP